MTTTIPNWLRWTVYTHSVICMALFGWLALESYRVENWVSLGNSGAWFFIGCWMFFGTAFTPKKSEMLQDPERVIIANASEAATRIYPSGQYVYLIQDVSVTGYFKIGKTNNPSRRMYDFGVLLPMRTKVVHIMPCQNMHRLEATLHQRYAAKRVNGEWFALDSQDVAAIKTL